MWTYISSSIALVEKMWQLVQGTELVGGEVSFPWWIAVVLAAIGTILYLTRRIGDHRTTAQWEKFVSEVRWLEGHRDGKPSEAIAGVLREANLGVTLMDKTVLGYRDLESDEDLTADLWNDLTERDWIYLAEIFVREGHDYALEEAQRMLNQVDYRMAVQLEFDPLATKGLESVSHGIRQAAEGLGVEQVYREDLYEYSRKERVKCSGDGCLHCANGVEREEVEPKTSMCTVIGCPGCARGLPKRQIKKAIDCKGPGCVCCEAGVPAVLTTRGKKRLASHHVFEHVEKQYEHTLTKVWGGMGTGKALHEAKRNVSATRRDLIMDGEQKVYRAVTRALLNITVQDGVAQWELVDYRAHMFHASTAGAMTGKFKPEEVSGAVDFAKRRLMGLALNERSIDLLATETAEVALFHSVYSLARWTCTGEIAQGLSKRALARIAEDHKLKWSKIRKGETDPDECLLAARNTTARTPVWTKVFLGLAMTSALVSAVTATIPQNPAKRAPVIQAGRRLKPTASVKYDYAPSVRMPYMPVWYDRNDPDVAFASFVGRVCKDNGRATIDGKVNLYRGTKWLLNHIVAPDYSDFALSKDEMRRFVESRKSWSRQKKDLHLRVIDEMPDEVTPQYLKSVGNCEAFIKDEFYPQSGAPSQASGRKLKAPRNICNRTMEFKIIVGTCLYRLNDSFFKADYCIKHVAQPERGEYLAERFSGKGRCLTTDHSAFESSANAVNQALCEQLVYRAFLPKQYWWVLDILMQPCYITNKATGTKILVDTCRMSGDFNTSLGNSILNASSAVAAYASLVDPLPPVSKAERTYIMSLDRYYGAGCGRKLTAFGDPYMSNLREFDAMFKEFKQGTNKTIDLTFMVEGDDAIVASPRLPDPEVYQNQMKTMGMSVTIEGSSDASKAGFCQVFWNETVDGITTYCDVAKQIVVCKYGTRPPSKQLSGEDLFRARLMSLLELFPGCPLVWTLLRGINVAAVEDNAYERDILDRRGVTYRPVGQWLLYDTKPVSEPTTAQRALFSELYGISPATQVALEQNPETALERFLWAVQEGSTLRDYAECYESMKGEVQNGTCGVIQRGCWAL